jgi:hypothetical protein
MGITHDFKNVEKTITMVLAAGIIAESVALAGTAVYPLMVRSGKDLFRITEDSVEFNYSASTGLLFTDDVRYREGDLFTIDSAEDLRLAFAQQGKELNGMFFLSIRTDIDVKDILKNIDAGLTICTWKYKHTIDSEGNNIDAMYHLYMFTVEYRDDFKVLQAFRNDALKEMLTADELALKDEAMRIIAEIIQPGMSDYEKVLAVHDYIILTGQYIERSDDPVIQAALHKTEGILMHGAGVCSSYAGSMYLLLNMIGVECVFVTGIARNASGLTEVHAWNKVLISGDWYNFDVTWNDLNPDRPGVVSYAYFGLTDEAFSATHIWDSSVYPQVADSKYYNYFYFNELKSQDYAEFKSMITRGIMDQRDNPLITVNLYVENFDPAKYTLDFIYALLPNIAYASCIKPDGPSGEFLLVIMQGEGVVSR